MAKNPKAVAERYAKSFRSNTKRFSPPTPAWTPFRYHPVQADLWSTTKRFCAVAAGRGSGKTEMAKRRLVRCLSIKKPWTDPRYFYGAPTIGQARRIGWNSILALIPQNLIADVRVGEGVIRSIFGVSLYIVGLDAPMRQEGWQWDGGVMDESCDIKPKAFEMNILPAMIHRHPWLWRIGVPKRFGVGAREFKAFYDRAATDENPEEGAWTWPSADIVDSETLHYAQSIMDAKDYQEQFGATWQSGGGGAFPAYSDTENVRPCPLDPSRPLVIGCDFNRTPMSWVMGHIYDQIIAPTRLEIIDELSMRDATTQDALNLLWSRYQNHRGGFFFHCDASCASKHTSADFTDYAHILNDTRFSRSPGGRRILFPRRSRSGIGLEANPSIKNRFSACNALFENALGVRRFFVSPECKKLRADIDSRSLKEGTWLPDDAKLEGHISDALGYLIYRHWPVTIDVEPEGGSSEIVVSARAAPRAV